MSWYSAKALADLDLPGLPTSKRGILELAKTEAWGDRFDGEGQPLVRKRAGRGGGQEYHVSLLPTAARARLLTVEEQRQAEAPKAANSGAASEAWQRYERLSDKQKETAVHRAAIMDQVTALEAGGTTRSSAIAHVARRNEVGGSTLRGWFTLVEGVPRTDWPAFVAPRYVGRTATAECSPEAWDQFVTLMLQSNQARFTRSYEHVKKSAEQHGWTIPNRRAMERRFKREVPRAVQILAREGAEAFEQTKPAQKRDRSVFHALEAVNADGHMFDVFVQWPGEDKPRRAMLVAFQDIYSGKILSWRLDKTENRDAVRLAYGDLVTRWGIPSHVYLDNGRAFASKWMTGQTEIRRRFKHKDEDPTGIFGLLGTEVHFVTPHHGQAKPIERAFRDLCDAVARHPAFVGAYTGNSPSNKPHDYGKRAIPLEEFAAIVDQGIAEHNARDGRRSDTCRGRSFDQTFAESYEAQAIRQAAPEQRRLFLLASEMVATNRKTGEIAFLGNSYWAEPLVQVAGKKVVVRFDPQHLHQPLAVYTAKGQFICEAECRMAVGFNDTTAAREHAQAKKARKRAAKDYLEQTRRMDLDQAIALIPTLKPGPDPTPKVVRADFTPSPLRRAVGDGLSAEGKPSLFVAAAENVETLDPSRRRRR